MSSKVWLNEASPAWTIVAPGTAAARRGGGAVQRAGAVAGVVGVAAQRRLHEHGAPAGGGGAVVHGGDARDRAEPAGERGGAAAAVPRWIAGARRGTLPARVCRPAASSRSSAWRDSPTPDCVPVSCSVPGHPAGDEAADDDRQPEGDHRLRTARREQRDRLHDAAQPVAHRGFAWRGGSMVEVMAPPCRCAPRASLRRATERAGASGRERASG